MLKETLCLFVPLSQVLPFCRGIYTCIFFKNSMHSTEEYREPSQPMPFLKSRELTASIKEDLPRLSREGSTTEQYKGDRFIPFRGTSDNYYMEEFILNNIPSAKCKPTVTNATNSNAPNGAAQTTSVSVEGPGQHALSVTEPVIMRTAERIQNSGSSHSSSTQYSLGSGNKKKMSFQELITESLFTLKRGSPNTLTLQEAEEEQLRFTQLGKKHNKVSQFSENSQSQRILSFQQKRPRPSLCLHKNISIIQELANEKTVKQQEVLRSIPQFPERILDAPDIVDDYYLNLLDWNSDNMLAVCLAQTVYLWNSDSGEIKQLFDTEDDNDIVTSVAWMKGSSSTLAIGTSSKKLHLFDTTKYERISTYENQHTARISSLSWNPLLTNLLSSGSLDSQILTNDIRIRPSHSIMRTFLTHRQEVCGLKWSPDGQQLASGGNDNMLCIWDINSNRGSRANTVTQPLHCFLEHRAAVKALAWCPWQRHLLASGGGSRDQTIKFWNTETGALVQSINTDSQVCSLVWNPFDQEILSSHGFVNNQLSIWKYPTMKKIADLKGHTSRVLHLALSGDGTTVASAAADETLRFWKVFQPTSKTGKLLASLPKQGIPSDLYRSSRGPASKYDHDEVMGDCSPVLSGSLSVLNGYSLR